MKNLAFGRTGRGFLILRQFIGYIHKKYYYQNQSSGNLSQGISSPKIIHFSNLLSHQTVNSKNTIPRVRSRVNIEKSKAFLGNEILVPINGTANQAAEMLIDSPDNALNQDRYCLLRLLAIN